MLFQKPKSHKKVAVKIPLNSPIQVCGATWCQATSWPQCVEVVVLTECWDVKCMIMMNISWTHRNNLTWAPVYRSSAVMLHSHWCLWLRLVMVLAFQHQPLSPPLPHHLLRTTAGFCFLFSSRTSPLFARPGSSHLRHFSSSCWSWPWCPGIYLQMSAWLVSWTGFFRRLEGHRLWKRWMSLDQHMGWFRITFSLFFLTLLILVEGFQTCTVGPKFHALTKSSVIMDIYRKKVLKWTISNPPQTSFALI